MEILNLAVSLNRLCPRWVIGCTVALSVVMTLGSCVAAATVGEPIDEYKVKAAFLYNFAKFVQWPAEAFQSSSEPFAICVLGQDPFGRSLDDAVAGKMIEGRAFVIRRIPGLKQKVTGCHLLFISSAENKHSPPILADVTALGTLTIGESDASAADGVIINFKLDGGKVRFEINVGAAEREKLRISSRLLSLAHVVESGRK